MNFKNPIFMSEDKNVVNLEIEHPSFGWIPYTFRFDEKDNKTDTEIREYLRNVEISAYVVPTLTIEEQAYWYMNAVQDHLDATARQTKWDNMQSARSAAGIPLIGDESDVEIAMHDDAVKLARWYLKVWAYCYAALDAIKAGDREAPESIGAFIEELPTLV